ncbi:MAG: signal recognition particle receptor subunit alpha [Nitrososphaerales archaeon]
MLEKLKEGLQAAIKKLIGATTVDEAAVKEFIRDLQRTLLQADVNVKQVLEITTKIEKRALQESPPPGLPRKDHIVKILYEELSSTLGGEAKLEIPMNKTYTIILLGIQGSGKTTVAAKLARHLQKKGYKVGVVCADTYRPGALTQLRMLGKQIGVEVYGEEDSTDAAAIAERGLKFFEGKDVVIVDTAGRHKEEKGLLEEMKEISSKITPDLTLLVVDGTIGQACYSQSKAFHEAVPVGGIIITKLDGAAKGGGALAAAAATGAKIFFIGTGERVDDLEPFSPTRFVGRLLGLGDIKALLERAKELEIEADEKKMQRFMSGKMTIDDLLYQLEQMKKMGSIRRILELIPGFSQTQIPEAELEGLDEKLEKWRSIILSMTKEERTNPEIMNASRIRRVARGSGSAEKDVKDLLTRYKQTKDIMKASKGRTLRQLLRRFQQT